MSLSKEDAWKGDAMNNYLKNPIILAFHNHSKPIGQMVEYSVDSKGLKIVAEISVPSGRERWRGHWESPTPACFQPAQERHCPRGGRPHPARDSSEGYGCPFQ